MSDLTAKFSLVDEISGKLDRMAESGRNMTAQWEAAQDAANAVFDGISKTATVATLAVDGVAVSIKNAKSQLEGMGDGWERELDQANRMKAGIEEVSASADTLADTMSSYGNAAEGAAAQTDAWTAAVGNYNRDMLEAIYSTGELVEMGLKLAAALEEQDRMFERCGQSASSFNKSIEAAIELQNGLNAAVEKASGGMAGLSDSEGSSAKNRVELTKASIELVEAMRGVAAAQKEAAAAMEAYNAVITSGIVDFETFKSAAERVCHATTEIGKAKDIARDAVGEFLKAEEKASEELENSSQKGKNAVVALSDAFADAGITDFIKNIAETAYGLVEAFSEAESTVVLATGATGDALDGLTTSMMQAYAASRTGSLDETAATIGEVNTRLGYTDKTLTKTTGLFLDFAAVTGGDAASSVRSVTQLMNQWNIPATEMESILDRLTYAGQASGISVDNLSQQLVANRAILDQLGFSLDEATAIFMNFELAGTNSTTVMTGLRTALSSGAIGSLEELYDVFDQISSGAMTAAEASEMFGSRAGPEIVNAASSGVLSLDNMVASLETADGTLATTAKAAQTLDQKWAQAGNNISTAFTTAIQPTVDGISSGMAGVMNSFGDFLNKHPIVTKAITALGVGLGVAVVAITAVSVASLTAIPAVAELGTAISAAIWPFTLIALAVTAVVGAVLLLANAFSAAEDETAGMTAATRAQYYELQDLNAEYEEACEKYGETSEEALRLKYQVDDLSAAFEANSQTVEEFTAEVDALCESVSQVTSDFNDSMTAIRNTEIGSLALIQKYEDLATKTNKTDAEMEAFAAVTKKLSESYPELSAQMDSATLSTEDYVEAMKKACEQEAEQQRQAQAQDTYVEALQKRAELTEEIAKAQENLNLEQARMDHMGYWAHLWTAGEWDDLEAYQADLDELNARQAENEATISRIEQGWAEIAAAEQAAAEGTISWEDAATTAYESVKNEVIELCEAYGEAYNTALESFERQFGLFDEASMKSEEYVNSTVENAQKALDSQLAYWDTYLANVEVLKNTSAKDLGITQENYEALMAYAQGGDEQAAGLVASMAAAINGGDVEAVAALANTVGEVNARKQETAAATADLATSFSFQMKDIEGVAIDGMTLEDEEAKDAATATINAYAESIREGKANVVAEAEEVANAVSAAFASAKAAVNVSINATSSSNVFGHAPGTTNTENIFLAGDNLAGKNMPKLVARSAETYANGTTDSTDYFIAGENGPELIVGEQGSTVFPTQETDRLISALNEKRRPLQVFADAGAMGGEGRTSEREKHILLEIAGSGTIETDSRGADKETILKVLCEHLKPVLMNIIQSEIYEEGELSYEY